MTQVQVPAVVNALITAQNDYDSTAFAGLFSNDAIVHDEGHTHTGILEIKAWIEAANAKYAAALEPKSYNDEVLEAVVSGNFEGSPATLHYHFTFDGDKIKALSIG